MECKDKKHLCKSCEKYKETCLTYNKWDPKSNLVFLIEYPSAPTIKAGNVMVGYEGVLLRLLIDTLSKEIGRHIPYSAVYATRALGNKNVKPSARVLTQCAKLWKYEFLSQFGQSLKPFIFIPFGTLACKSLGMSLNKIDEVRGRRLPQLLESKPILVYPTYSLAYLFAKPGITRLVQRDLLQAIKESFGMHNVEPRHIDDISKEYVYPKTVEEVEEICNQIIAYRDPLKDVPPDKWPIAVDIETNTLKPYKPGARVLMVSFAWDDGKATSIILDHPSAPYDPKEVWPHVARVLASPKPKTFHNGKFDLNFLMRTYGLDVKNFTYDTMLGEHFLEEDKAGSYSLKVVAATYCPDFTGYEDLLKEQLRSIKEETNEEEDLEAANEYFNAYSPELDIETLELDIKPLDEIDPNYIWTLPPKYSSGISLEDQVEYTKQRNLWFFYDARRNSKARTEALKAWKAIAKKLNLSIPKPKASTKKVKLDKGFEDVKLETLLPYAAADADLTRQIHKKQRREAHRQDSLKDLMNVMDLVYVPASLALGEMEYLGTKVDYDKLDELIEEAERISALNFTEIRRLTCSEVNPNSGAQLGIILEKVGIEFTERTESTNAPSTKKDTFKALQEKYAQEAHETKEIEEREVNGNLSCLGKLKLIEAVLFYKDAKSFLSKFGNKVRDMSAIDGKIHTSFLLHGTATGRLSSSNLNLQNLPLKMLDLTRPNFENPDEPIRLHSGINVKSLLIPEHSEDLFFNVDISAAEIRVLAFYSEDEGLIKALNDGADTHLTFLTKIKHKDLELNLDNPDFREKYDEYLALKKVGDKELEAFRKKVKAIVFATVYGGGAPRIAQALGDTSPEGLEIAKDLQMSLFVAFPKIHKYIEKTKQEIRETNQVRTQIGRWRRFWTNRSVQEHAASAIRAAVNFKIQSTASDLLIAQLLDISQAIKGELGGSCRLTVHDSLSGVVKKSKVLMLEPFFQHYLVGGVQRKFPWMPVEYKIDIEVGPSYGEVIPLQEYLKQQGETVSAMQRSISL